MPKRKEFKKGGYMSFTAKQIEGGVVEIDEHAPDCNVNLDDDSDQVLNDYQTCTCKTTHIRDGIDAQSSVPFRFNREKLAKVLFSKDIHFETYGTWDNLPLVYKEGIYLPTADAIIAADKEIVEVDQ